MKCFHGHFWGRCVRTPSDSPLREKAFREVCENLRKKCNHEVPVELREVAEIPLRKGKLKYIISDAD